MATVRCAEMEDLTAVVALWNRAAGPTRRAGHVPEATRLLQRDPDALLVAEAGGEIIGTLIVGWDGWRCHMYRMAVDPEHRRAGVARMLIARARERAVAVGAPRVDASVDLENSGAVAFWESVGFERDSHDSRWSLLL